MLWPPETKGRPDAQAPGRPAKPVRVPRAFRGLDQYPPIIALELFRLDNEFHRLPQMPARLDKLARHAIDSQQPCRARAAVERVILADSIKQVVVSLPGARQYRYWVARIADVERPSQ